MKQSRKMFPLATRACMRLLQNAKCTYFLRERDQMGCTSTAGVIKSHEARFRVRKFDGVRMSRVPRMMKTTKVFPTQLMT